MTDRLDGGRGLPRAHGPAAVFLIFGLLVVAAALTPWWYLRPFGPMRVIGLDGRAVIRDGRCYISWREVICNVIGSGRPMPSTQSSIQFNRLTRHLNYASRSWTEADSAQWSGTLDSVRTAMSRAGGVHVPCDNTGTGFPVSEGWRFGGEEVRLYGGHLRASLPRPWYAGVYVVSVGWGGCGPRMERVYLTPAQIGQRLIDWLSDHSS